MEADQPPGLDGAKRFWSEGNGEGPTERWFVDSEYMKKWDCPGRGFVSGKLGVCKLEKKSGLERQKLGQMVPNLAGIAQNTHKAIRYSP
jgi:hypothetical protein